MQLKRLNNLFAKRGGDLAILFFSLLLAFFMWSMYRMTKKYSAVFDYKIELSSNIEGRAQKSEARNSLVVRGTSSGFYILQQKYLSSNLQLFVDSKHIKPLLGEKDMFYLKSSDIQHLVQETLGNDFQLENVSSDTLYFHFPRRDSKKVPVVVKENISFDAQYTSKGNFQLRPDSVVIYGNEEIIRSIESVSTKLIRAGYANEPIQGIIDLQPVKGVRFSDENIYYWLDVVRYFENSITIRPAIVNVPLGGVAHIIPQEITLSYRMQFEDKKELDAQDFIVVIDYNDIENSNMVKPKIVKQPNNIFDVRFEPKFIECIIN